MNLSQILRNKKFEHININQVRYSRISKKLVFDLTSKEDIDDESFSFLKSSLEDLFQLPVEFEILVEKKEVDNSEQGYYERPIIIKKQNKKETSPIKTDELVLGRKFTENDLKQLSPLSAVDTLGQTYTTQGKVFDLNSVLTKNGYLILSYHLEDYEGGAISCKSFFKEKDHEPAQSLIQEGENLLVKGRLIYDDFSKKNLLTVDSTTKTSGVEILDKAPEKRVEFGVHTIMSNMEGLIQPKQLSERLQAWGHRAVGVTDFGSVQSYPLLYDELKSKDIKLILGYEAKILHDDHKILTNQYKIDLGPLQNSFTVFDIETTGFSKFNDRIIEIGAVRYENGEIVAEFNEFVYPERSLPVKIIELTGITDSMLQSAEKIETVLPRFLEFSKDSIFVAHNADFDIGFIVQNAKRLGLDFKPVFLDTLGLARCIHPEYKNHKLNTLTKNLGVRLLNHHRASDDARATGTVFLRLMDEWKEHGLSLDQINKTPSDFPKSKHSSYRSYIYVKEQAGVKNLYKLVSIANIETFFRTPGILEEKLREYREGLIYMSGFVGSDLFEAIASSNSKERILEIANKYDVFCVQAPGYWEKAENDELVADKDHYKSIVEKIIRLADELGKQCIALNSPYYFYPGEKLARNILVNYQRKVEFENDERYRFFTTEEMLEEFSWLGSDLAYQLVVTNTNQLADSIDDVLPIPEGTFTPELEGADEDLRDMTYAKAKSLYGDPLPQYVEERLERELDSIISNGYASLYVIAQKLVEKSNQDGYLVGSRGSVGSSFAATMADITEVNPLVPHYACPSCKHSEFIHDGSVGSGFDLEAKKCPKCGTEMNRDGHNIPFEVFLGFNGDKEPDIDLNFAGSYMSTIHQFTEELFGKGKVFRAGTISGVQSKTAYGFIKKYMEQDYIPEEDHYINDARISSLQRIMEGTRRTTGQHAGGLMIIPENKDVLDFTPIQYPADDQNSDVITTHFSYKNLEGRILKLDELGHTSPTIIRQLQELTGIDALSIEFDDEETMKIFSGTESLGIKHDYSCSEEGSLGIPEFGTNFVRGMLSETKPTSFAELTRISGLSHGTDVWLNNAQELIQKGITSLTGAICTRDDIMTYLISMGLDDLDAFKTMEAVRKGRGLPEGMEEKMIEKNVPAWYIESCKKIKYMFPKAHAAAYVMMSYRIAWFKVHSPAAFYATYYSQRLSDFSTSFLFKTLDQVQDYMKDLKAHADEKEPDVNKWTLLEVIEEMHARDYSFAPVDLYQSEASSFTIQDDRTILPPLAALDDVSEAVGQSIIKERDNGDFISREDFKERTGANKSAMASMEDYGLLDSLPASNQMSFIPGF